MSFYNSSQLFHFNQFNIQIIWILERMFDYISAAHEFNILVSGTLVYDIIVLI